MSTTLTSGASSGGDRKKVATTLTFTRRPSLMQKLSPMLSASLFPTQLKMPALKG